MKIDNTYYHVVRVNLGVRAFKRYSTLFRYSETGTSPQKAADTISIFSMLPIKRWIGHRKMLNLCSYAIFSETEYAQIFTYLITVIFVRKKYKFLHIYIYIYIYSPAKMLRAILNKSWRQTPHKAPTIRPPASHHENYQS